MLVLTRKIEESIQIGDDIKIKIIEINGNVVALGIEAPRDINVVRTEVLEAAESEKKSIKN